MILAARAPLLAKIAEQEKEIERLKAYSKTGGQLDQECITNLEQRLEAAERLAKDEIGLRERVQQERDELRAKLEESRLMLNRVCRGDDSIAHAIGATNPTLYEWITAPSGSRET